MRIEQIHTGQGWLLYRVTDDMANEYMYIMVSQGELTFLEEIDVGFITDFWGSIESTKENEDEDE